MQAVGILAQGSIAVLLSRKARAVCLDRKDVDGASPCPTSRSNTCGRGERPAGRAELLANPAIRARIFAGSIQIPGGLTNLK